MRELNDKQALVSYLLNDLPEGEQDAFEGRYFEDDELYTSLLATEEELIESYLQGDLPRPVRKKFERQYLTTSHGREKVAELKGLLDLITDGPGRTDTRLGKFWASLKKLLVAENSARQFSFAALSLLAVLCGVCSWLLWDRSRLQNRLAQSLAQSQQRESEYHRQLELANARLPPSESGGSDSTAGGPGEPGNKNSTKQPNVARPPDRPRPREGGEGRTAEATIATFVMPRGPVRSADGDRRQQEPFLIRRGATTVRLKVRVEDNDYVEYTASLQRVGGGEVWKQAVPKAQLRRSGELVSVDIPARFFDGKHFIFKVLATPREGQPQVLAFHQLIVENQNLPRE